MFFNIFFFYFPLTILALNWDKLTIILKMAFHKLNFNSNFTILALLIENFTVI
jgi:hypothetical protein